MAILPPGYASALDNWNRYTGDPAAPEPADPLMPQDPLASIDQSLRRKNPMLEAAPHPILAFDVPGTAEAEAPADPTAPGASPSGSAPGLTASRAVAEGGVQQHHEDVAAGAEYAAASPTKKLQAMGDVTGEIQRSDIIQAWSKGGRIWDPRNSAAMEQAALEDPEVRARAQAIADARKHAEFTQTGEGRTREAEGQRGMRPVQTDEFDPKKEPVEPSDIPMEWSPRDLARAEAYKKMQEDAASGAGGPAGVGLAGMPTLDLTDEMAAQKAALGAQGAAEQRYAAAEGNIARQQAEAYKGAIGDIQTAHDESMIRQQAIQQDVDRQDQAYQQAVQELAGMKDVDSGRLLRNPFMALLAVAGGAVGGAYGSMTGTHKNQFMDNLNHVIARDVMDQKMAIEKKRGDVAAQQNLLGYFRQKLGDERQAENAVEQFRLNQLKMTVDRIAADNGSEKALANGDKTKAAIDEKLAALNTNLKMNMHTAAMQGFQLKQQVGMFNASQKQAYDIAHAQQAGRMDPPPKQAALEEKLKKTFHLGNGETVMVQTSSPEELTNLRKSYNANLAVIDLVEEMQKNVEKGVYAGGAGAHEFDSHMAEVIAEWGHAHHLGTLDEGLVNMAKQKFGSSGITGDLRGDISRKLAVVRRNALRSNDKMFDSHVVIPGKIVRTITEDAGEGRDFLPTGEQRIRSRKALTDVRKGEVTKGRIKE